MAKVTLFLIYEAPYLLKRERQTKRETLSYILRHCKSWVLRTGMDTSLKYLQGTSSI